MQENEILAQADSKNLKPQHWMLGGMAILATLGMAAAIAVVPPSKDATPRVEGIIQDLALDQAQIIATEDASFLREERVQRGDTLSSLIARLGIRDIEANRFLSNNPGTRPIHRQLAAGKTVMAETSQEGELHRLVFPLNDGEVALVVERQGDQLVANEQALRFEKRTLVKSAEIRSSLFGATDANDIPDSVATQLAEIFNSDIDFHHGLRKGDHFSVTYEMNYLRGRATSAGRVLAAEFTNNGKTLQAIYFEQDGKSGYYNAEGKSLKKAFLRSPLEFSRISSSFGTRLHPIHLDIRQHKGIDYVAPTGTRIRAVSDGTVEFAGKQGGYGNLVVLRHNGQYSTAYGHLSAFGRGLKKGARVSQGDIIGFVGATGWATGPHLHYEFRINNKQVNPLAMTLPTSLPIDSAQLPRFRSLTQNLTPPMKLVWQAQHAALP